MPKVSQLGRVIVPVSDQDAAIAFYTDTLGFTVSADVPYGEGDRWVEVEPPGGGAGIALSRGMGEFQPGRETGIALSSPDPRADYEELKGKGVVFHSPPAERPYGVEAVMRDDSGNYYSVVQRPR